MASQFNPKWVRKMEKHFLKNKKHIPNMGQVWPHFGPISGPKSGRAANACGATLAQESPRWTKMGIKSSKRNNNFTCKQFKRHTFF
jgi:hypothetical protein